VSLVNPAGPTFVSYGRADGYGHALDAGTSPTAGPRRIM